MYQSLEDILEDVATLRGVSEYPVIQAVVGVICLAHFFWSSGHICKGLLLHIRVGRLRFSNSGVLIACFNPPGQDIVVYQGYSFNPIANTLIDFSKLNQYFFQT